MSSSRSTSYSSSSKTPLSCQSGSRGQSAYDSAGYYDPRYSTTMSDSRSSGYSSKSSSSKPSRSSKPDKVPLSISQGSSSRDPGRSKTEDERYYASSFHDSRQAPKKPLSCQKGNDERYYSNSSYYP